jgi:hypothetical protein
MISSTFAAAFCLLLHRTSWPWSQLGGWAFWDKVVQEPGELWASEVKAAAKALNLPVRSINRRTGSLLLEMTSCLILQLFCAFNRLC